MRFHNNNVTIVNLVNARERDEYGADFHIFQGSKMHTLGVNKQNDITLDFGNGDLIIERRNPSAVGMILNTGIRNISLEYELVKDKELVGPSTDTIPMGQFKEIGAGPGVLWNVCTFRGNREKDHAAMER